MFTPIMNLKNNFSKKKKSHDHETFLEYVYAEVPLMACVYEATERASRG